MFEFLRKARRAVEDAPKEIHYPFSVVRDDTLQITVVFDQSVTIKSREDMARFISEKIMQNPLQTFGQRMVGLTFNPSGDERVAAVKQSCADVLDIVRSTQPTDDDHRAMIEHAVNEMVTAQMWAVKVLTWKK
jgi:hypothetical protein